MAVIVATALLVGSLLRRLGQPAVIGEIIGGILLGPSFLGRVAPDLWALLFPPSSVPFINVIAQLGVILYMFLVGLKLDLSLLRDKSRAMAAIATGGIVLPFA